MRNVRFVTDSQDVFAHAMAKNCPSVAQIEWREFSKDKTTLEALQQSITHRFWLLPSVDGETHDLWRVATYKFGTTNPEYLPHRHTNAPEVIGKVHNEAVWMLQSLLASVVHTYYMLCNPLGELAMERATNAEPGSKLWWQGFLLDRYKVREHQPYSLRLLTISYLI